MARGTDGSLMTKAQLRELNKQRFIEAANAGNLYNIGPITDEGATSFSPDRWASYFEANPEEAPSDWTGDSESYMAQEPSSQEFLAEPDKMKVTDQATGELLYEDGRDTEAMLKRKALPSRGKDKSFLTEDQAKSELAKEVERDMAMEAEIEKDFEGDNEFDMSVPEWVKEFDSMSEEDFYQIDKDHLKKMGENAIDGWYASDQTRIDKQAAEDKAKSDFESKESQNEIAKLEAEIKSFEDSDVPLDAEVGGMLTEGKAPGDMKEAMVKTELNKYGLNDDQAKELMGRLKGLCN